VTVYPYQPSPLPTRGRNRTLIIGCAATVLVCVCLFIIATVVALVNPFNWRLTTRLAATPSPTTSATHRATPTRLITHTATSTFTPTFSPTPSPSPTPTDTYTPTSTVTPTSRPTSTYTATMPAFSHLTVCMASEPATLFIYSAPSYETKAILDAILDGPIDYRTYEYVPVIFEDLPTLENGGVAVQAATVHTNDRYVDANDNPAYWARTETKMDQIVVTFRLKAGVLWSDGTPLTADDFQFGYEIARDSAASASDYAYLAERTAGFTALDNQTIQWVGLPGYTDPNFSTHFFPPISRQAYGSLTPEQMVNDQQINTAPLGWGPFRIVEWVLGDRITLERNPYYFRAAEGLPYLDQVVFRFVPEDQILAELAGGNCDVGAQDYTWEARLDELETAQAAGKLALKVVQNGNFEHLDFNLQPIDQRTPYFAETGVRQALAYCLDRQAIIDEVYAGLSTPPDSFLPPDHPFYNPQITRYEFDPQKGLALLKAAGWEDHNGDGLLDQSGGSFSVTLHTRDNLMRDRIAPLIASQLRDNCGMDVTVEYHTYADLFSAFPDGLLAKRSFDLAEFFWLPSEGWQTCSLYTSSQIPSADLPAGPNFTGYANPEYDAACQAGMEPRPLAERRQNYQQAQKLFTADLPSLPLFWRLNITVTLPFVSGLNLDPSTATDFFNIELVQINP
jgi:peptide/nickel transport system substrate-binding protein